LIADGSFGCPNARSSVWQADDSFDDLGALAALLLELE